MSDIISIDYAIEKYIDYYFYVYGVYPFINKIKIKNRVIKLKRLGITVINK